MSATQSNLSDLRFGYDLVIAVTQASLNATMKTLLLNVTEPEVTVCYVYDANNNLQAIDYATLKINAKGSDPFAVLDGSDPNTNQDLINLTNANFAGAVRAQIGLPPDVLPKYLPPILTLGAGIDAPVTFNLLCSEFIVAGFDYGPRGRTTWIKKAQNGQTAASQTPWYFSSQIFLKNTAVGSSSNAPSAVQDRAKALKAAVGPDAFSIQQLFLDLTTAMANTAPTIEGLPDTWAVWGLIETVFVGAYFKQLAQSGEPVLSYTFSVNNPIQSTLQLGAISRQYSPLMDNGKKILKPTPQDLDATTFVYLGTTSTTVPTPVEFPWNWVELGEVTSFSGVLSTRRGVFLNFLAKLLDGDVARICFQPTIYFRNVDTGYIIHFAAQQAQTPSTFQVIDSLAAPDSNGFTDVMTVSFSAPVSNDCNEGILTSIHGEFNYTLSGTVSLGNDNQIRLVMHAAAYMLFSHKELFVGYTDLDGANYYDKTYTFLFTMGVNQNGHLEVTSEQSCVDHSVAFNFQAKGLLTLTDTPAQLQAGLNQAENGLSSTLDNLLQNYGSRITSEIDGYSGWVFPGANSFISKDVMFSSGLDLITQLTYADPS